MKNIMRDYLKDQGIDLHKAKSWTLRSKSNTIPLKIKSWRGGYNNQALYYTVSQGNLTVYYRGEYGFEVCLSYKDKNISFEVDSMLNEVKLKTFTHRWVEGLINQEYRGAWRPKKNAKLQKIDLNLDLNHSEKCLCLKCEMSPIYFSDCKLKDRGHKSLRYVVAEDRNGELIWTEFENYKTAEKYADQIKGCVLDSEQRNRGIYRSKGYKLRKMKREKRLALNRMRVERL